MELTMNGTANSRLATYNTLALHYQDEAYTLAYYLAEDESRAEAATQSAFNRLYTRPHLRLDQFRLEILHGVWAYLQHNAGARQFDAAGDELRRALAGLPENERMAVVLVDVIGLDYEEAGRVMDCTKKQTGRLLAQGRMKLGRVKYTSPA